MAHILIIEDYRDTSDIVNLILGDAGHTVSNAADGLSGVEMAAHIQPDLILMDLSLPRLDGWSATEQLKACAETRHIPVIAFTAHVSLEEHSRAWDAGCATIITKPFELDALLMTVNSLLEAAPAS